MRVIDTDLLEPVISGELTVPYAGEWLSEPYESKTGRTLIAEDPGISSIVVDDTSGEVVLVGPDGDSIINGSLATLVACARLYTVAINTEVDDDDPDGADERWEEVGAQLEAAIRAADPVAAGDEESFWAVAAEEVGYGMQGGSHADED
jgi:hypothetical protein